MAKFTVPKGGLVLDVGSCPNMSDGAKAPPIQVMQLDLEDGMLEELLRCARHGSKPIHVAFGKTISLQYGTKTRRLDAVPATTDTQVFTTSSENTQNLTMAGRVSHQLAVQKAEKQLANTDDALAKLQASLASAKQAKDSNQIHFIPDGSKLPPAKKQTVQSLKQQHSKGSSLSFLKNKGGASPFNNPSITRSTPGSPAISGSIPSTHDKAMATSAPRKNALLEAIRTPLIHLLAVRPLSVKYIAQKIGCSQDVVKQALEKVGKEFRLDPTKWDLNDKTYKDLDVWKFDFSDQQERELAIDRATFAFDRMRMSQDDPKWQMLYPKSERGKGKTLSRLNHLHKGPIQQSTTPRIHVQQPEDSVDEKPLSKSDDSDQKGRLTPKASEMARSKSTDQIKKTKVSEKEAQAKRLLNKGPKKVGSEVKEKQAHPAVKKGGPKKGPPPKSDEFVRDSDEEDGLEASMARDALSSPAVKATKVAASSHPAPVSPAVKGVSAKVPKKKAVRPQSVTSKPATPKPIVHEKSVKVTKPVKPVKPVQATFPNLKAANDAKVREAERKPESKSGPKKIPSSPAATPGAKQRLSEAANQSSTAMQKSLSRGRTLSSPLKPSPLGSSPPTNASEFYNYHDAASSTSATPPSSSLSSSKKSGSTSSSNGVTRLGPVNGHVRNLSVSSDSLKPNGHTRSNSDTPLKRKANDLDSGIHNHASPHHPNGRVLHPAKKPKTSANMESDSSTSPLSDHELKLQEAQRFKQLHARYEKAYQEVAMDRNASPDAVKNVQRMHQRLGEMKRSIAKGLGRGSLRV